MLCHSLLSLLSYGITNIYFISLIPNFGHLYFYSYKCHWAGDFFYTNPFPDVCFVSVFPFDQGPWKWGSGARREERSKSCMRLTILSTGSRAFRSTVHSHFHLHRPDGTHACFFDGLSRGVLVVVPATFPPALLFQGGSPGCGPPTPTLQGALALPLVASPVLHSPLSPGTACSHGGCHRSRASPSLAQGRLGFQEGWQSLKTSRKSHSLPGQCPRPIWHPNTPLSQ